MYLEPKPAMETLLDMIVSDSAAGRLIWTCGGSSDLYSAEGPGYRLSQRAGGIICNYFICSCKHGYLDITIGPIMWMQIKKNMTKGVVSPQVILDARDVYLSDPCNART